jgi:hypothetical protein
MSLLIDCSHRQSFYVLNQFGSTHEFSGVVSWGQRAQPIDCVAVWILAESTVGTPVSEERGGPSPQCLPTENERSAFESN